MFINLAVHSHYSLMMSSNSIDDIINYAIRNKQKHVALIDDNTMYGTMEFYNKAIAKDLLPIIGLKIKYEDKLIYLVAKNNDGYHNLLHISSFINTEEKYDLNLYLTGLVVITDITSNFKTHGEVYSFDEIALQEAYFEKKNDVKYVKALMAIKSDALLTEFDHNHDYDDKYMFNEEQANQKFSKIQLENLEKLINSCSWDIKFFQDTHFVKYDPKVNSKILLQTKCKEGLKQRLNSANAPETYLTRLVNELNVIDKMNFNDYFLVVQDYVNFAKRNGILVGPGRGSAAGSLVAYVLGVTEIDPIKNDLIFERFLNPERATMPDIDIDFMDSRRDEIIQYLYERYTKKRVAHIITFQRMKAKMAIRDAGRILGIELPIINNISKLFNYENDLDIPNAIKNDSKISNFSAKYPELFDFATKFTNYPRQVGLHAAGVVITNNQLHDFIPIQNSTDGIYSTQYSMEYLEPLGLIKMDILGLVNLTTIDEALKLIKINESKDIDLSKIRLDDVKVFKQLSNGDTVGIFQLESPGMRKLIMDIKPTSIEDISITSALFRPGPQQNIPTYLSNKANPDKIEYLNDDVKKILQPTYNVIIYQEQVMQIVQQVGNYSLAQADLFRRAISKKNADKLALLEKEFITAAEKNKYSYNEAQKIYDYIYKFANYGFNHSHSLAYSYISYWMAYLKTYYPLEYFTVLLSSNDNSVDKISQYIQSARGHGLHITPPSINESEYSFTTKNKSIIFGLNAIKGIGRETITKILMIRNNLPKQTFSNYLNAITTMANNSIGVKTIEILIKAGAFDNLLEKRTRAWLLHNLNEIYEKSKTTLATGEMLIKPILSDDVESKEDLDNIQFELLGISFKEHPMVKIKDSYKGEYKIVNLSDISDEPNAVNHVLALLISHRIIKTKTGQAMAFAKIEDETKIIDVAIFPGVYDKCKSILNNGNMFVVAIKPSTRGYQALSFREY